MKILRFPFYGNENEVDDFPDNVNDINKSTNYVIEGMIDRYGRRRPTNSKFKTRGKEKKYSRRINDNRFDIKGGLYERRQHVGIGDYQANGTHISVVLKTNERSGSSNGTSTGRDSSTHSNSTHQNLMIFLIMLIISIVYTQPQVEIDVEILNTTMGQQKDNSDLRNQGDRVSDKRSEDTSRHGKNGIRTESILVIKEVNIHQGMKKIKLGQKACLEHPHLDTDTGKQEILKQVANPDHVVLEDMALCHQNQQIS
ncbi:hypothetical protein KSF78_0005020 [Schistosoma japonicum]|nr:hypothetical protein KSF78_0005020 [Schistosoma japonicum]